MRSRVNFVRDFFVAVLIALTPNRPRIIHPLPDHSQHLIAYRTNMIAIKLHTSDCNQPSHHPNHFLMIAIKLPPSPPTPPSFSYIDCNHNINTLFMQRRPLAIFTLLSSADTTPQTIDLVPKHLRPPPSPVFSPRPTNRTLPETVSTTPLKRHCASSHSPIVTVTIVASSSHRWHRMLCILVMSSLPELAVVRGGIVLDVAVDLRLLVRR